MRLDLMLDIFQGAGPASLARGKPRASWLTWLFQVDASAVPLCQMRALPHLTEGTTAMADRRQLTTGTVARFS